MKAIVLGAGKMGRVIAKDLVKSDLFEKVTVTDISQKSLDGALEFIDDSRADGKIVDVTNQDELVEALKGYDIGAGAVWHKYALNGIKAAIEVGLDYVDLVGSFPEED